jgi:hypothetical protein
MAEGSHVQIKVARPKAQYIFQRLPKLFTLLVGPQKRYFQIHPKTMA